MSTAYRTPTPPTQAHRLARPRELGVYELPDGRRFVASALHGGGCGLYAAHAWGTYGEAEYRVGTDGRVLSRGVPTVWSVLDLRDMGRTASYPQPILL